MLRVLAVLKQHNASDGDDNDGVNGRMAQA